MIPSSVAQMDERLSRMDAVISTFREQVISQGQKVQTNTLSSQDRMIEFEKRLETFREQIVKSTWPVFFVVFPPPPLPTRVHLTPIHTLSVVVQRPKMPMTTMRRHNLD